MFVAINHSKFINRKKNQILIHEKKQVCNSAFSRRDLDVREGEILNLPHFL
jgi:hypothetical protein